MYAVRSRLTAHGLVAVAAACLAAGCAAAATPSPLPRVGLHIDSRISNVVLFQSAIPQWTGTPPPLSSYSKVVPACGGHLDVDIPIALPYRPSVAGLGIDTTGMLDHLIVSIRGDLDLLPDSVRSLILPMWTRGDINTETWLTITPTQVVEGSEPPQPSAGGACAPWAHGPS
jgi:hypothetical protein